MQQPQEDTLENFRNFKASLLANITPLTIGCELVVPGREIVLRWDVIKGDEDGDIAGYLCDALENFFNVEDAESTQSEQSKFLKLKGFKGNFDSNTSFGTLAENLEAMNLKEYAASSEHMEKLRQKFSSALIPTTLQNIPQIVNVTLERNFAVISWHNEANSECSLLNIQRALEKFFFVNAVYCEKRSQIGDYSIMAVDLSKIRHLLLDEPIRILLKNYAEFTRQNIKATALAITCTMASVPKLSEEKLGLTDFDVGQSGELSLHFQKGQIAPSADGAQQPQSTADKKQDLVLENVSTAPPKSVEQQNSCQPPHQGTQNEKVVVSTGGKKKPGSNKPGDQRGCCIA